MQRATFARFGPHDIFTSSIMQRLLLAEFNGRKTHRHEPLAQKVTVPEVGGRAESETHPILSLKLINEANFLRMVAVKIGRAGSKGNLQGEFWDGEMGRWQLLLVEFLSLGVYPSICSTIHSSLGLLPKYF